MAIVQREMMDTDWRFLNEIILDAETNAGVVIADVSAMQFWAAGSIVNISKIFWTSDSPAGGVQLYWDAGPDIRAITLLGNGNYGYQPGQPALLNPQTEGVTGDIVLVTGAAATGTIVIECHKYQRPTAAASGTGGDWPQGG
mgnify:FL=1